MILAKTGTPESGNTRRKKFSRSSAVIPREIAEGQDFAPPSEAELEAYERDYQSIAERPIEGWRVREARRFALERFLERRSAVA